MPREIQFMDLAGKCEPKKPPPPEILSIGETQKRISKLKEGLKAAKCRIDLVNSKIDDLQTLRKLNLTVIEDLQEQILKLEETITPVTIVKPRTRGKKMKKSEREELLNMMLNMSVEDIDELQQNIKKGR
jgi:hypothetical protein